MAKPRGYRKATPILAGVRAPKPIADLGQPEGQPKGQPISIGDLARDPWPIPANAAWLWLTGGPDGEVVRLGFTPSPGHVRGHSVNLPSPRTSEAKAAAWDLLCKVLRERRAEARIAEPGAPDQRLLDAYAEALARGAKAHRIPTAAEARLNAKTAALAAELEALGIDELELNL